MADLVITAANVLGGYQIPGVAGVALTAGQVVYQESATGLWKLADSNGASAEMKLPGGIAACNAAANQPVMITTSGDVTIGATLVAGTSYYSSETPGGIEPGADLATTENVCLLGIAKSTTVLSLRIVNSGVVL